MGVWHLCDCFAFSGFYRVKIDKLPSIRPRFTKPAEAVPRYRRRQWRQQRRGGTELPHGAGALLRHVARRERDDDEPLHRSPRLRSQIPGASQSTSYNVQCSFCNLQTQPQARIPNQTLARAVHANARGILSANYERYEAQARALFVRERARIVVLSARQAGVGAHLAVMWSTRP